MLSLLFGVCMLLVFGKILIFGIKVSWGILKILLSVVFLPFILIGLVISGLLSIAFPILIVIGIGSLFLRD